MVEESRRCPALARSRTCHLVEAAWSRADRGFTLGFMVWIWIDLVVDFNLSWKLYTMQASARSHNAKYFFLHENFEWCRCMNILRYPFFNSFYLE